MTDENTKNGHAEPTSTHFPKKGREGDGGTYLVVADDSEEFGLALKYACMAARQRRAHVGILRVIEDAEFQHWGAVEEQMKRELRLQAENYLWTVAAQVNEQEGMFPSLYIADGNAGEAVIRTVAEDHHIVKLILGGGGGNSPGPLVTYCTGRGYGKLRVPLTVVPNHS